MLWPLLVVSATAAIVIAILSSFVGRHWAIRDVQDRYDSIEQTIHQATFPLTMSVLSSLAKLSGTDLIAVDVLGAVQANTLDVGLETYSRPLVKSLATRTGSNAKEAVEYQLGQSRYLALGIPRPVNRVRLDNISQVIVLFDESRVLAAGRRAGLLPLVTGLSTIILLTALMTAMTGRLAGRLSKLQAGVERVADGDFESPVADHSTDEIGRLGQSVDKMAAQLKQLWQQVNRQQSQKLLHQIASGMAHQLRNTLTGARLALELHRQSCPSFDKQEVDVALGEMEGAEDYVRRLLLVGAGEQQVSEPANVLACLCDIRSSHAAVA
ncbi:MAG: HAMP domain-containing protein, partial [Aureliella sp.]